MVTTAKNTESESEDNEDVLEEYECQEDEEHLTGISQTVLDKIGVCHPITYDVYNICKLTHDKKLSSFKAKMLKEICNHFELSFKSRDIKADLMNKLKLKKWLKGVAATPNLLCDNMTLNCHYH